jgi:RND family efflux transporter MFP subunit
MMNKLLVKGGIPLLILLVGGGVFWIMVAAGAPPQRQEKSYLGPLVKGMAAPLRQVQILVEGQGTVEPSAQIDLVPQVGGVVVWKSPQLEQGGFFAKGDPLVQIDPRDYELALERTRAEVAQAAFQLDLARQEAEVARQEWDLLEDYSASQPSQLVLRLPQLRAAEASHQAAQARLAEAQLRLERTKLYAPFAGRVRQTSLDVGQFVNVGQPVARLYSIEKAQIVVSVPDEDLAWFDVPLGHVEGGGAAGVRGAGSVSMGAAGAEAIVKGWYGGRHYQWRGRVVRTEGEIDPQSRMVRLVVEVDDPYGDIQSEREALKVGMFVDVDIVGRQVEGVRVLPRMVLRPGNTVWTAGPAGLLKLRSATVVRTMGEDVVVRFDMAADERVVLSQLSGVTEGMKVRLAEEM